MTNARQVAAFVPNLMDRSRFGGSKVVFVSTPSEVAETEADLVIVDLDRCDDVASFRLEGRTVVGFGSHVDVASAEAATSAGFDEVMARSVFFRRLPELLAGT